MAARDPNTGQFIPAGADRTVDRAYEDFDIQQIRTEMDLNTPGSGDHLFEPWHVTEPLGGLQRDELAELVAHETHVSVLPTGSGDDPGRGRALGSIGFDGVSQLDDINELAVETEDVDGVDDIDRRVIELEQDPDILDYWEVTWQVDQDDTNGVGYAYAERYDNVVHYRPVFGRGPVVDRHTDLFLHLWEQLIVSTDQSKVVWDTTLVWDVFARD